MRVTQLILLVLGIYSNLLASDHHSTPAIPNSKGHGGHNSIDLQGTWNGNLPLSTTHEALKVSLDILFFDPNNYREYPQLSAILKIGLGGSDSPEYETDYYPKIHYSYEKKEFTLADDNSDIVLRFVYKDHPQPHLEGRFTVRSLRVDESLQLFPFKPGSPPSQPRHHHEGADVSYPLVPTVTGDYRGRCGKQEALLQISAAKGLTVEVPLPSTGLHHYLITGRLAFNDPALCGFDHKKVPTSVFCHYKYYNQGAYNFYEGRLLFSGSNGTMDCHRLPEGRFSCEAIAAGNTEHCEFAKVDHKIKHLQRFPRRFHADATAEDLRSLPFIGDNDELLLEEASGEYWGYLHHENRDLYQPMLVKTASSRSSENPHILDHVFVTAHALLYFGDTVSQEFIPQSYERRIFSNYPDLSFSSMNADSVLQVTRWTAGAISGVYFSKLYGRVGTFELLKRTHLSPLPSQAAFIPSLAGGFRSFQMLGTSARAWQFNIAIPQQAQFAAKSYLNILGGFRLQNAGVYYPWNRLERGSYDFYTGNIGIITEEGDDTQRIILARALPSGALEMFWPSAPRWGTVVNLQTFSPFSKEELK